MKIFVCSHLRPVAQSDDGRWFHIVYDGALGGINCVATIHEVEVSYDVMRLMKNPVVFQKDQRQHRRTRILRKES